MNSRLVVLAHNGILKSRDVNRLDDAQNRTRSLFALARSTHAASIIPLACKSSRIGVGRRNARDLAISSIVGHIVQFNVRYTRSTVRLRTKKKGERDSPSEYTI